MMMPIEWDELNDGKQIYSSIFQVFNSECRPQQSYRGTSLFRLSKPAIIFWARLPSEEKKSFVEGIGPIHVSCHWRGSQQAKSASRGVHALRQVHDEFLVNTATVQAHLQKDLSRGSASSRVSPGFWNVAAACFFVVDLRVVTQSIHQVAPSSLWACCQYHIGNWRLRLLAHRYGRGFASQKHEIGAE